jgi:hypothetical protein
MVLTKENFDEILEMCSAKYLPYSILKLVPAGIVYDCHLELDTTNPPKIKMWNIVEDENIYRDWDENGEHLAKINNLIKQIPKYFQKHSSVGKKYWNTNSSYGSKHFLSDEMLKENPKADNYCTNGEFILAMWLLDYDMKKIDKPEYIIGSKTNKGILKQYYPNVTFNCSYRDLNKIVCPCGLQYTKAAKKQHERSNNHQMIMTIKEEYEKDSKKI